MEAANERLAEAFWCLIIDSRELQSLRQHASSGKESSFLVSFFVVDRLVLLMMVAPITTAMILMVIRASVANRMVVLMWTLKSNLSMIIMQCYLSNYDREGYSISCKHEEKVAYYISILVDIRRFCASAIPPKSRRSKGGSNPFWAKSFRRAFYSRTR